VGHEEAKAVKNAGGEHEWSLGEIFMHLAIDEHYLRERFCSSKTIRFQALQEDEPFAPSVSIHSSPAFLPEIGRAN